MESPSKRFPSPDSIALVHSPNVLILAGGIEVVVVVISLYPAPQVSLSAFAQQVRQNKHINKNECFGIEFSHLTTLNMI